MPGSDTVHVKLNGRDKKVRVIGVNYPEIVHPDLGIEEEPYSRDAKAYTERQLTRKKAGLESDVEERDKYCRLLAYVWLKQPSPDSEKEVRVKMYNARLLIKGYAQVVTLPLSSTPPCSWSCSGKPGSRRKGLWGAVPALVPGGGTRKQDGGTTYVRRLSRRSSMPDCRWAHEIAPQNRAEFRGREEVVQAW